MIIETNLRQCCYINISYIPIADQNFRINTFCALLPKYVLKRFVHKGVQIIPFPKKLSRSVICAFTWFDVNMIIIDVKRQGLSQQFIHG